MKRIIKLRGELILGVCISTVAAVIIALTFNTFYREKTLTEEKLVAMATEKNNHDFDMVKKQLQVSSNNENLVYENMKRLEKIINYSDVDRIFNEELFGTGLLNRIKAISLFFHNLTDTDFE